MTASDDALSQLDDYTSGVMADADAAFYEAELFAAAADGRAPELAFWNGMHDLAAWFAMRGGFATGITRVQLDEIRKGDHVHYLDVVADTVVPAWPETTEIVAYRVDVDLRGCDDVQVELRKPDGTYMKTFRDVQYDPADGAIYALCDVPIARGAFRTEPIVVHIEGSKGGAPLVVADLHVRQP
jgi:hypothetical protein